MSVKIRLKRTGKKKAPTYRVVVAKSTSKRDGRIIEAVGSYDPRKKPMGLALKRDRIAYWLDQGAIPTQTVGKLLKRKEPKVEEAPVAQAG